MLDMKNGFEMTDDDCMQCYKKVGNDYMFIQAIWLDTTSQDKLPENAKDDSDTYVVVMDTINVKEMSDKEKTESIYGFYSSLEEVYKIYGEASEQIIAECYFENEMSYCHEGKVVSWADAEKEIQELINKN